MNNKEDSLISHGSVKEMFEDIKKKSEDRRKKRGPIFSFFDDFSVWFYWTCKNILNIPYNVKYFFQRMKNGYADSDLWDLFSSESKRMVKMLTRFKQITHGYPNNLTWELWMSYLDDIIFYHQHIDDNIEMYKEFSENPEKWASHLSDFSEEYNFCTKENYDRFRRGRYYFYKYYQNLWS